VNALDDFVHLRLEDELSPADSQNIFFRPINLNAAAAVRIKTVGSSSLKGTTPISIHKLLKINRALQEAVVATTPLGLRKSDGGGDQPVVLRTAMTRCPVLLVC
jgi:hypothetical protein